jgi:hypothetical protein
MTVSAMLGALRNVVDPVREKLKEGSYRFGWGFPYGVVGLGRLEAVG